MARADKKTTGKGASEQPDAAAVAETAPASQPTATETPSEQPAAHAETTSQSFSFDQLKTVVRDVVREVVAEVTAQQAKGIARGLSNERPRDEREAPDRRRLYFARRPFGYAGKDLDREQLVKLTGQRNDAKLVDLKYLALAPDGTRPYPCRVCGAEFLSQASRDAHGQRRHEPKPVPRMDPQYDGESEQEFEERRAAFLADVAALEDAEIDREERMLDEVAPIDLTKSAASRMG